MSALNGDMEQHVDVVVESQEPRYEHHDNYWREELNVRSPPEESGPYSATTDANRRVEDDDDEASTKPDRHESFYRYYSKRRDNPLGITAWLVSCLALRSKRLQITEEDLILQLSKYAELIQKLRNFHEKYVLNVTAMLNEGHDKIAKSLLMQLCKRLYSAGAPLWVLQPVMGRVAKGLLGTDGVEFVLYSKEGFAYFPDHYNTVTFRMERGINIHKFDELEAIAIKLASFASNTASVSTISTGKVTEEIKEKALEIIEDFIAESLAVQQKHISSPHVIDRRNLRAISKATSSRRTMQRGGSWNKDQRIEAKEIIQLAAEGPGMYYYNFIGEPGDFWDVEPLHSSLFSYLAASEALYRLKELDEEDDNARYHKLVLLIAKSLASAGAAGFWFNGGWADILVSGLLGALVATTQWTSAWRRHERPLYEIVMAGIVGLITGLIVIKWPNDLCFGAIGVASLIDLFQGFRIVFAVLQLMSHLSLSGTADLVEALLFTALIAYFLRFGQYIAAAIESDIDYKFPSCSNAIPQTWYLLLVPISACSWSVLFLPKYRDIPAMTAHGIIAFAVSWGLDKSTNIGTFNSFFGAMVVTFVAGIYSRFSGRHAIANTMAGLYVLVPGAYALTSFFESANPFSDDTLFTTKVLSQIVSRAVIIGLGGWTGTLICSPTVLGTNREWLRFLQIKNISIKNVAVPGQDAMFFL